MEAAAARFLASPIPQEYDASTVDELGVNPAESEKLAARHNLVEIAEACRKEAKYSNWIARNPASVQPVEIVTAGCWLGRSGRRTPLATVVSEAASWRESDDFTMDARCKGKMPGAGCC